MGRSLFGEVSPDVTDTGKVTDDSPLTVQFNGTATSSAVGGVLKADSYTPVIGDDVLLIRFGPAWFVMDTYTP
jgi:hypothetical protein